MGSSTKLDVFNDSIRSKDKTNVVYRMPFEKIEIFHVSNLFRRFGIYVNLHTLQKIF